MCANNSAGFPGRWGELAELLRETHATLELAGAAGVCTAELAAVSRAARQAVKHAGSDVDLAVEEVGRLVLDARSLACEPG